MGIELPRASRAPATAAVAILAGLLVLLAGLWIAGYPPGASLAALWNGAFGSWYSLTSATLVRATPLIVMGIGVGLAFRSGAFNIGAEGQFYAGAMAATWVGLHVGTLPRGLALVAVCVAGLVGGALWILIPIALKLRLGVLEVISTLLLNFVAEAVVSFMVQGPLQESKHIYPQSETLPIVARLPALGSTRLHLGFIVAVLVAVVAWLVFSRSIWGFRLKAVGAGPRAAHVIGRIDTNRQMAWALLLSGALAGLAGAFEVSGVTYALFQNLSPGYGFTAIAVALLARLNPLAILATALLFGALQAGATGLQRDIGVPAVAVDVVQAVIILAVAWSARPGRRDR